MKQLFLILFLLFASNSTYAQNFNFALVTDIHVSKGTTAFEDLQLTIESINKKNNIDFVLVTGDLTETGDKTSLYEVKNTLKKLKVKYFVTAGNHETKWSESGYTDFNHIFGSDRFSFEHNGIRFLGFNTGPIIRMMDGHVAPQDIAWLKNELQKTKPNQPIIIVTHYPLKEEDVDNWYEVTDLIRNYNIKAILGGHYHKNEKTFYDGIPAFINRSNLRAKNPFGGYSVYEVTQDSILVSEQIINKDPKQWGGYSLTKQYYTKDNSLYKRPDYTVNSTYPNIEEVWSIDVGNTIYSSPVIIDDKILVGDDLGRLICYSLSTQKELWTFKTGNRILGTPAANDKTVVFGSTDKNIYGIDLTSGKLQWKVAANEPVIGAVTIENDIAYIGASDHCFRAIRVSDGKALWANCNIKGYIETKPLTYQDKVIFGAWDNTMYALNKLTGQLIWSWNGGLTRMHYSPAAVWPVTAQNKIFFTAPDRVLTALDATTGETLWRSNSDKVRETIGVSEDRLRVYSKTMQDTVVCYSTTADVPKKIWATNVAYGYDHAASMPGEKDGIVFGSTKNGITFALDAYSGKLQWKHKTGNSLINTIVPLNGKECIFTSAEGKIVFLRNNQ